MKFQIDKTGPVPLHLQLREQIIFKISTGELVVGETMESVRGLARSLKIHHNTVSQVYKELVAEHWLVYNKSRRLIVLRVQDSAREPTLTLDSMIDQLVLTAQKEGLTPLQLTQRILERTRGEPLQRLLIVEPERGMGEMMKCEIHRATGLSADAYSISELRLRPELLKGAILLVPGYLIHLLDFVPAKQRAAIVPLKYSLFDAFVERVSKLSQPSVVGLVSVTGPGLRTITGPLASALNTRHEVCYFWLEWPPKSGGKVVIRRLATHLLPPDVPVLVQGQKAEEPSLWEVLEGQAELTEVMPSDYPVASMDDVQAVDLLLCDSITYDLVQHRNRLKYQLLSAESLQRIAGLSLASVSN